MIGSNKSPSRLFTPHAVPRGVTLIELMIAISILSVILIISFEATNMGLKAFVVGTLQSDIRYNARKAVDTLSEELIGINPAQITEPETDFLPPANSGTITFKKPTGYDLSEEDFTYSNTFRLTVVDRELRLYENVGLSGETYKVLVDGVADSLEGETPNNNEDDNGNGLVDEGGLCFAAEDAKIFIALTLERTDEKSGQTYQATVFTNLKLRNDVPEE